MKYNSRTGLIILSIVFILYILFWLIINIFFPTDSPYYNYFSDSYGLIAAVGGYFGYLASKKWGGMKSYMGKALALLSIGLFFQFLGQVTYAIYFYAFNIENAYPSIGDFFYFGSIPLYIGSVIFLYKVFQIKIRSSSFFAKSIIIILPLVSVIGSYLVFLKDYDFTDVSALTVFLDFGYPIGEAIFLSLTIIALLFTTSTLGGKLKVHVKLLLISLIAQYIADTIYLVNTMNNTWHAGGMDDFSYLVSYALMGFTLISFGWAAENFFSKTATDING